MAAVGPTLAALAALAGEPAADPASCPDTSGLTAAEKDERLRAAVTAAVDNVSSGDLDRAMSALEEADCYERRPAHDFMRGAILKERGDCGEAVQRFDAFLAEDVPEADAAEARLLRQQCLAELPAPTTVPDDPPPDKLGPPRPQVTQMKEPLQPCPPPPRPDGLGVGLTVGGAAVVLTGIGLVAGAQGLKAAAPNRATLSEHDQAITTARVLNPAGFVALGVGAAVLAGGAARLALVRARRKRDREQLPPHCL